MFTKQLIIILHEGESACLQGEVLSPLHNVTLGDQYEKVIGLVLLIALLSGCTPGSDVEVVTDLVSIPSPSHIQEQLSNILQVNATVDVQDIDLRRLSILPCTFQVLNTQAALDLLCSDEKIVSHEMTSTEGLGPNAEQNIYRFKSGAMLICGNTLCCYSTSDAEKLLRLSEMTLKHSFQMKINGTTNLPLCPGRI